MSSRVRPTRIEAWLEEHAKVHVDFEVDDALDKLVRLELATGDGEGSERTYAAVDLDRAIEIMQRPLRVDP